MFEQLTERLTGSLHNLSGKGRIKESHIQGALKEVRKALLEADVALSVVKDFIARVKREAIGQRVLVSLQPDQVLIKIVHQVLTDIMGESQAEIDLACEPPAVLLMAGLQGAGKTTSSAKLARWLSERQNKKVWLVSVDVYRPAAIQQLATLAETVGAHSYVYESEDPMEIAKNAMAEGRRAGADVIIFDTAGRLHVDEAMMAEIKQLHALVKPQETLFVVDAMTGQDAVNTAKAFHEALPLTGVILSKADGDARGGAALSVRAVTGKPIKFLGMGEKVEALEAFHPDRMASRILDMGDVLSLVEEAERNLDHKKVKKMGKKLMKGRGFDFTDMLDQFGQMRKLGGMSGLLDKMPGMSGMAQAVQGADHENMIKHMEAMILSMTGKERASPDLINGSRKRRIAAGSGMQLQDVNRLLKQFKQMQKMMKRFSKKGGGMGSMMQGLQGMMGPNGPM